MSAGFWLEFSEETSLFWFHSEIKVGVCVLSHFSHVRLFATLWTVAHQGPLSMGILQARILE